MSPQPATPPAAPVVDTESRSPVVGAPHPALESQLAFTLDRARVLTRARVSGQRLVATLSVVLDAHGARSTLTDGQVHLSCTECRTDGRAPAEQYPCPTAQQAVWALDAVLG